MLTREAAIAAGEDDAQIGAGTPRLARDVTGRTVVGRDHAFTQVQVGDEEFYKVGLLVCDCVVPDADLQLGEDWLRTRVVWLGYTGKVFIRRGGEQQPEGADRACRRNQPRQLPALGHRDQGQA